MQFPFQVILSFLTPIVCCLPTSDSAYAQIDIQKQIQEFETGSKIDQMTALRSMASLVIRGEATIDQRQQVLNFLKEATKQSSPEIRLTVYVELLKVGLAENNLEIGNFALKAIDDKNLNVHRGILRYFRTFFPNATLQANPTLQF